MARNVGDAALLLDVMADAATGRTGRASARRLEQADLAGVRIGVVRDCDVPAEVEDAFEAAAQALARLGAKRLDPVLVGVDEGMREAARQVLLFEFKDGLNRYLADHRTGFSSLAELIEYNAAHAETVMPRFGQELFLAAQATAGLEAAEYKTALAGSVVAMRNLVGRAFEAHGLDALLAPVNVPAGGVGSSSLAAVGGCPSVAVPWTLVDDLPIAVAFVGRPLAEQLLIDIATRFEEERGAFPPPLLEPKSR